MPHQCVKCGTVFANGAAELLKGCSKCTGRFFFFVKEEDLEKAREITTSLSDDDKRQMEFDVMDIVGDTLDRDKPIILDFESIRVLKPWTRCSNHARHLCNRSYCASLLGLWRV